MARFILSDPLQQYPFHLVDIEPSKVPPFFALSPILGFSACSGIETTVEAGGFTPMNSMWPVHHAEGAEVAPITLSRGTRWTAQDFDRWMTRTIKGTDRGRRNLMLIHFMALSPVGMSGAPTAPDTPAVDFLSSILPVDPSADIPRIPGRVFILHDCLPTSYRTGEWDASSGEIQIAELELQPHHVTEVSLGVAF